jgi:hypothetical protein
MQSRTLGPNEKLMQVEEMPFHWCAQFIERFTCALYNQAATSKRIESWTKFAIIKNVIIVKLPHKKKISITSVGHQ